MHQEDDKNSALFIGFCMQKSQGVLQVGVSCPGSVGLNMM